MTELANPSSRLGRPVVTRRTVLGTTAGAAAVLAARPALAVLEIDINQGNLEPTPIAVTDLFAEDTSAAPLGRDISSVVSDDLDRSKLFRPIAREAFIQQPSAMQMRPRFIDWRTINAQALVTGRVLVEDDGRIRVEFRLWDVFAEQQMAGLAFTSTPETWRRVAHLIADQVYERLTGEKGYFDTRIVYVSETGPAEKRIKRLAIMDQDGFNHRFLTDGSYVALTPRFSPTAQEITYLALINNRWRVYIYNIDTGQQEVLGDVDGDSARRTSLNIAPRFSPDGRKVIMSMSKSGNHDIYTMDLQTRKLEQLTFGAAINTSPSFSPDGTRITFNSDKSGYQQLYVMNADGSNSQRISGFNPMKRGSTYATPVWSPRGDFIAFTRMSNGVFSIGVMHPDGSKERDLTDGTFFVEGPTWAPNGRVLMYQAQERTTALGGGEFQLWTVDLVGNHHQPVDTPFMGSDPAWSPPLSP